MFHTFPAKESKLAAKTSRRRQALATDQRRSLQFGDQLVLILHLWDVTGLGWVGSLSLATRHADLLSCCRSQPATVRSGKQLVLDALVCDQLPRSKLTEAWLPPARIWSAACQASIAAAADTSESHDIRDVQ